MNYKTCSKCGRELPMNTEYFYQDRNGRDGLKSKCIECVKQSVKKRAEMNRSYWKTHDPYNENETKICRVCRKEYPKTKEYWYKHIRRGSGLSYECKLSHDKFMRDKNLRKRFGITLDQYNKMFEEQDGRCAICGKEETIIRHSDDVSLAVDHDHKTGKIRKLVCHSCNVGLGFFSDDVELLEKAIKYLKSNGKKYGYNQKF